MRRIVIFFATLVISIGSYAGTLNNISNAQADQGLKQALEQGATAAVNQLSQPDGFLNDPKLKIPLPPKLQKLAGIMRAFGQGQAFDQLDVTINRAAAASVPAAKKLLIDAVRQMSLTDAKQILTGGNTAGTEYFRQHSQTQLQQTFLPIVSSYTDKLGLAQQYDRLAGQAAQFGLVSQQDASIESYVTQKTLDALYRVIGDQEQALRADPIGYTSHIASQYGRALLQRVFGALQ